MNTTTEEYAERLASVFYNAGSKAELAGGDLDGLGDALRDLTDDGELEPELREAILDEARAALRRLEEACDVLRPLVGDLHSDEN